MTVVGEAFVRVSPDDKDFGRRLTADVEGDVRKSGRELGRELGEAVAGGIVLAKIGSVLRDSVGEASDLNESVSKTEVVFGNASSSVLKFGEDSAQAFGQSQAQALGAASTFGNLFRSIGLSEQQSAQFSTTLTGLASDLASFNNTSVDEAIDALRAGVVGETEPLKRFGVNLNDVALKAEATALGLGEIGPTLTANQKAQAAYSLILKQTALAQGDFARTADGAANQQRILEAEFANAKATLGESLLPAYQSLLGIANDVLGVFNEMPPELRAVVLGVGGVGVAFGVAAPTISRVLDVLRQFRGIGDSVDIGDFGIGGATTGLREFIGTYRGLRQYGLGVGDSLKGASNQVGGLVGALGGANLAVAGLTATVGIGLATYSAWATNVARVREETEALSDALIDQQLDVQQTLLDAAGEILSTRGSFKESATAARVTPGELARLVGLDPGAFDQFREYMNDQIGGSLPGPLGDNRRDQFITDIDPLDSSVPESLQPLIGRLQELYENGELTGNQFREIIDAGSDLSQQALGTAQDMTSLTEAIARNINVGAQSERVQNLIKTAMGGTGISLEQQRQALLDLAAEYPNLAAAEGLIVQNRPDDAFDETGDAADRARQQIEGYADALSATFDPVFGAVNAANRLRDAQLGVTKAERDLAEARANRGKQAAEQMRSIEEARIRLGEAQMTVAERQRDYEVQVQKRGAQSEAAYRALDALNDAKAGVGDAQRNVADQERRLQEIRAEEAATDDVAEAERRLEDAKMDVVEAAYAQDTALARLRVAIDNGDVSMETFNSTLQRWIGTGAITEEQARLIRDRFEEVRVKAEELDGKNVKIKVEADGSQAEEELRVIAAMVDELARAAGIDPDSRDGGAQRALGRIRRRVSAEVRGGGMIGRRVDAGDTIWIREQGLPEMAIFGDQGQVLQARNRLTQALLGDQTSTGPASPASSAAGTMISEGAIVVNGAQEPLATALEVTRQMRAEAWRQRGGGSASGRRS